jgi:hypothetical protein
MMMKKEGGDDEEEEGGNDGERIICVFLPLILFFPFLIYNFIGLRMGYKINKC